MTTTRSAAYAAFDGSGMLFLAERDFGLASVGAVEPVPTPPCYFLDGPFGWDDAGSLYYSCGGVRRRNGEIVLRTDSGALEAVLPSGRTVVSRTIAVDLIDVDGSRVSGATFEHPELGSFYVALYSATVVGEHAFIAFVHASSGATVEVELGVMRVDGDTGEWHLVRRLHASPELFGARIWLALPDGRLVIGRGSELSTIELDGSVRAAWSPLSSEPFDGAPPWAVFVGPRGALTPAP